MTRDLESVLRENEQLRRYAAVKAGEAMFAELAARDIVRAAGRLIREPFSPACRREMEHLARKHDVPATDSRGGLRLLQVLEGLLDADDRDYDHGAVDFHDALRVTLTELRKILRPDFTSSRPAHPGPPSTGTGDVQTDGRKTKNE